MSDAIAGFVGVVLGGSISIAKDFIAHWTKRRRAARYAAVRIVCVLDQYVEKCVEVVGDDGTAYGRPAGLSGGGEEYYEAQVSTPEPPIFPADIDWTSISPDLMYRVLALPNLAIETDRCIAGQSEHSSFPDFSEFFDARQEGYADLGIESLSLADELRSKFRLSKTGIAISNPDWDNGTFLRDMKAKRQNRQVLDRAANAAMFEELTSGARVQSGDGEIQDDRQEGGVRPV